jgi:hypothetical protein
MALCAVTPDTTLVRSRNSVKAISVTCQQKDIVYSVACWFTWATQGAKSEKGVSGLPRVSLEEVGL